MNPHARALRPQRPQATVSDLGQTRLIDGTWYKGTATAIKVGPDEYETRVVWYLAKWKDVAKARRKAGQ